MTSKQPNYDGLILYKKVIELITDSNCINFNKADVTDLIKGMVKKFIHTVHTNTNGWTLSALSVLILGIECRYYSRLPLISYKYNI